MNWSVCLENLEKHFCNLTYIQKNLVNLLKIYCNTEHLSKKFISNNLLIIDIALRNQDLSIIGIAQGFLDIIDCCYRFSIERFIVPIAGNANTIMYNLCWSAQCDYL